MAQIPFAIYCKRTRKEGIMMFENTMPAREVCPLCGSTACGFSMVQYKSDNKISSYDGEEPIISKEGLTRG